MSFLSMRRSHLNLSGEARLLGCWRGNAKNRTQDVTVTSLLLAIEFAGASHAQPQVAAGLAAGWCGWLSAEAGTSLSGQSKSWLMRVV